MDGLLRHSLSRAINSSPSPRRERLPPFRCGSSGTGSVTSCCFRPAQLILLRRSIHLFRSILLRSARSIPCSVISLDASGLFRPVLLYSIICLLAAASVRSHFRKQRSRTRLFGIVSPSFRSDHRGSPTCRRSGCDSQQSNVDYSGIWCSQWTTRRTLCVATHTNLTLTPLRDIWLSCQMV